MNSRLFEDNPSFYAAVLEDMAKAKKVIYFETFRLSTDEVGKQFINLLEEKAKSGIEIKLLLDAYGTPIQSAFHKIKGQQTEVRFFKKFKLFLSSTIKHNNSRNHRKLVLIDDRIIYLGSSNVTSYSSSWKELNLRLEGEITHAFKNAFLQNWEKHKIYDIDTFENIPVIKYKNFDIVQDTPSARFQKVRNYFLEMIQQAKSEIILESPYFLPGFKIRKALKEAAARGVSVHLFFPKHSDVHSGDLLRNRYMGSFYKSGMHQHLYESGNLHAKSMMIDRKRFFIGSSNFDYRSFRFQFEIGLGGEDPEIVTLLKQHYKNVETHSSLFDYSLWEKRSGIDKLMEWLIMPFRKWF